MTTSPSTAARFQRRADDFARAVAAVQDWDGPTPSDEWTARDVVAHVIETERDFLDQQGIDVGSDPGTGDPAAAWQRHAAGVGAALADPEVVDREYDGYFGRTTIGSTMADFYGWDLAIHAWDLSRAAGQPWPISDEDACWLDATAASWGEGLYADGICAAPVETADDASAQERLLGRLGRDPRWAPPAVTG